MLKKQFSYQKMKLKDETMISLPGIEIRPERRRLCYNNTEIYLTAKEFDILHMLTVNKGRVVTYEQIYQNVWNEYPAGRENSTIGYHVRNLRKKLSIIPTFSIQCIREMGYCLAVKLDKT